MKLFAIQFTINCIKPLILICCIIFNINLHGSGGFGEEDRGLYGKYSPDFPLNDFVNGQLGVINPSYRLSYLIIAYRYLSNNPLSKKEQRSILNALSIYFYRQIFLENYFQVDAFQSNKKAAHKIYTTEIYNQENKLESWWKKLKELPLAEHIETIIKDYPKDGKSFTKFKLASQRLKSIVKELNAARLPKEKTNAILLAWLQAQDQIFQEQYDENKAREAIKEIPVENIKLLQLDTDYMLAVSYFKSEREEELLKSYNLFTQLANNPQFPWHEWADYLSYRALTRAACQNFYSFKPLPQQTKWLTTALTGMQKLATTANDYGVKKAANDYKNIIRGRIDREEALIELVQQMHHKITKNNFSNMIFYSELAEWNSIETNGTRAQNWNKINADNSEILFWIRNYLSPNQQKAFAAAYEIWLKAPNNLAWLLVALNNIEKADASQQSVLLEAAERVTPDQSGFFSIRSALIQAIYILQGDSQNSILKRHTLIDETLTHLKIGENFSTRMHFYKMGLPLANSVDNLLSYGFFIPSSAMLVNYPPDTPTTHPYYSPFELSKALNYLPLSVLVQVLHSKQLPLIPKQELYASVWARAMLLGQYTIADQIAKKTGELNPALNKIIQASLHTKNKDKRLKILIKALLYFPELSPIINLKNTWTPAFNYSPVYYGIKPRKIIDRNSHAYWCSSGGINRDFNDNQPLRYKFYPFPWLSLLTSKEQQELNAEQAQLIELPDGAAWLANKANELAKKYPKDKENAELLALAINVTRVLSCYETNSHASQHAYVTLKRLYPTSEGAKRTKYYY